MGWKLGAVPLWGGELGPHVTQCGLVEAYLHAKFHLDPSNRLATVHQRHRQDRTDRTDRQRSDSEPFYKRSPKNEPQLPQMYGQRVANIGGR